MFYKKSVINEARKEEVKNALLDQQGLSECVASDILQGTHYALDGRSLLQRLPWTVGSTFDEIFQSFKNYLWNNYVTAENTTDVFDGGYLVRFTKDSTHIRRSKGRLERKVLISLHNLLTVKKSDFLLRKHNKQAFLVMHSDGDADVDIVSSTLSVAKTCSVELLGEDTDLIILLLLHYNPSLHHPMHLYCNSSKTAVDIKKSKQLLSDELKQSILAILWVHKYYEKKTLRQS